MSKILTIIKENKLILLNGTMNYGHEYGEATYYKTTQHIVVLSGLVKNKELGELAHLPDGYRPDKKLVFTVDNNDTPSRVDVLPDGRILWVSGKKCHGYGNISLSGINFYVGDEVENVLPLKNDWVPYGGDYGTPTYVKTSNNIVVVSGMAKDGGWGLIAHLQKEFRPKKRLVFNVNNNNSSCRVDVLPDGRIIWVNGGKNHGWVSLSGIIFSIETGDNLSLLNCWKSFGETYQKAAFKKTSNGLILVTGRIHNGKKGVLAKLPTWAQPTKRLIFNLRNSHSTSRVDVLPDGRIIWINGGDCYCDISLSGIVFFTEYGFNDTIYSDTIIANHIVADSITSSGDITSGGNITSDGDITSGGNITATSFTTTSDKRCKKNIRVIKNCLDRVKKLRGVNFTWIKDESDDFGVIAQEVEEVAPHAVKECDDGIKRVDYSKLTVILIEAIKEQSKNIDVLSAKVNRMST